VRSTSTPSYLSSVPRNDRQDILSVPRPLRILTVPRMKTDEFARRAFRVATTQIWNDLPVIMYNLVSQFMFLNGDPKLFLLTVHN